MFPRNSLPVLLLVMHCAVPHRLRSRQHFGIFSSLLVLQDSLQYTKLFPPLTQIYCHLLPPCRQLTTISRSPQHAWRMPTASGASHRLLPSGNQKLPLPPLLLRQRMGRTLPARGHLPLLRAFGSTGEALAYPTRCHQSDSVAARLLRRIHRTKR